MLIPCSCSWCNSTMKRHTGAVNRAHNGNYNMYCSAECLSQGQAKRRTKYSTSYRLRRNERIAGRPSPAACDVCGSSNSPNRNGKNRMHFDHCHKTGVFRGWICGSCNRIIGLAKDDPRRLRALADYLER